MKTSGEAGGILIEESWGKCRKRIKGALPGTVHHAPKTCIDELGEWTLVLNVAWACTCNCKQSDWKQQFASIRNGGRRMDLQDQTNWVKLEIQFLPVTRLQMLSCQRGPSKMNERVLKGCTRQDVPLCPIFNFQQRCLAVPLDFMMLVPLAPCRCIVMVRCTSAVAEERRRWMICPYPSFRFMNGSWQRDVTRIWC